jgi:hypothetical protein
MSQPNVVTARRNSPCMACPKSPGMAGLDPAIARTFVLLPMARSSRAMTRLARPTMTGAKHPATTVHAETCP